MEKPLFQSPYLASCFKRSAIGHLCMLRDDGGQVSILYNEAQFEPKSHIIVVVVQFRSGYIIQCDIVGYSLGLQN